MADALDVKRIGAAPVAHCAATRQQNLVFTMSNIQSVCGKSATTGRAI
jgi:hypothetical protein